MLYLYCSIELLTLCTQNVDNNKLCLKETDNNNLLEYNFVGMEICIQFQGLCSALSMRIS